MNGITLTQKVKIVWHEDCPTNVKHECKASEQEVEMRRNVVHEDCLAYVIHKNSIANVTHEDCLTNILLKNITS